MSTTCGTEHKYHTVNTPEWPNSHKLKIQDGGGRHLEFRNNVNNSGLDKDILHQIIWEHAPRPCGDDRVTKSRNRKLIRVTSSNECLKHMCVDGGGRHLEFRKNVNKFGLDKDILHQIIWEDASLPCDDHLTKSRNRKLIRVTSSNECLKHMRVDLSDYNRYLNPIWYRTQIPHYQHAGMAKFT